MEKEIIYLTQPDFFNKFLLSNFNQKVSHNDSLNLTFEFNTKTHLGSSLKSIYLLEIVFPRKPTTVKLILRKKKILFGQKSNTEIFFRFDTTIKSIEFFSFFRFFCKFPLKKNKINDLPIINRKLKQFEFNKYVFILPINVKSSFNFMKYYHLI